ncbi:MAG: Ig-like domain-containing protein [Myxococcaceae bacterium]|nr:Ig-like domain-containing protein [Myxococcaceae bacterium]
MFELVGTVSASPGREVTSATIDVGDGMARPLTLTPTMWRVTVPLPASLESTRTFTLSITDQSGQTTSAMVQVLIDTRGPQVALTMPASTTVVGASVMLSGTVADASLPPASFSIAGGSANVNATVTGTTWTATVAFPANIDRLTRTLTWTAADTRGNSSTGTFSLLVDTQPPALALTSPAPNVAVGRMATLSGTATDSSGPPSNVTIDLGAGPTPLTVVSGAWTTQATFPMNLDRVMRTVTLRGTDAVGNQATVTAMVLVDTQGPTLTFTSPAAGERLGVPAMQVVTGAASDSTALMGVTLNCGDSGGNRTATISTGTWSVTWPLPTADNTSFTCTATATDSLANVTTLTRSFFVDTVAPVVAFTAPASGAIVGGPAQTMLAVTGTVSDGSPVSPLQVTFNAATNMATPTGTTWSTGFTLPTVDYVSTPLSVTATDAEGNATTIMRSVFVDRVAPVVTMTAPNAGQVFNIASFGGGSTVNVTWTVTDGDPTRTVQSFNGTTTGPTSGTIGTNASDNGVQYTATVTVADRAGNVSSPASRTFTVDRVAPTVVSVTPANGSRRVAFRQASIVFSEVMNSTVAALNGVGTGSWTNFDSRWESQGLAGSTVFAPTMNPSATDLAGNPVTGFPAWRFHTGVALPPNPQLIATGATRFDVMSDLDGHPFVAWAGSGITSVLTAQFNGTNGTYVSNPANLTFGPTNWREVAVQVWSTINPDLSLSRSRSLTATDNCCTDSLLSQNDGIATGVSSGIPILTPPIRLEDGTSPTGVVSFDTYMRSPVSTTLSQVPTKVVPGNTTWAAISFDSANSALRVAQRACGEIFLSSPAQFSCSFAQGSQSSAVPTSVMSTLSGAVSPEGCLILSFDSLFDLRRVYANRPGRYATLAAVTSSDLAPGPGFTVSPRSAGGHWGAWLAGNGTATVVRTTNTNSCPQSNIGNNFTTVATLDVEGSTNIRVVELGSTVGVFYLKANGDLMFRYVP